MNTYRVKARYEHPCGRLNAVKVFNTPAGPLTTCGSIGSGIFARQITAPYTT